MGPREQLLAMSPHAMAEHALEQGWVTQSQLEELWKRFDANNEGGTWSNSIESWLAGTDMQEAERKTWFAEALLLLQDRKNMTVFTAWKEAMTKISKPITPAVIAEIKSSIRGEVDAATSTD